MSESLVPAVDDHLPHAAAQRTAVGSLNIALNVMNYHSLPTGGFDSNGNVKLPSDFAFPSSWSETVGRVTQSPDWGSLLKILGALTVPNTDYTCYRVAVSFSGGILRIVLVKDAEGLSGNTALNWSNNVWSGVLKPLKAYAGRRKALPPVAVDALKAVNQAVSGSPYWSKPIPDGIKPGDDDKTQRAKRAAQEAAIVARDLTKWRVETALSLVGHFLEFIAGLTSSSKVLTTVLWYHNRYPHVYGKELRWPPVHQLYDDWNQRAVHYWWNVGWRLRKPGAYPFVYSSTLRRKGWGITDVPHQPWELAARFYPLYAWRDLDQLALEREIRRQQERNARCRRVKDADGLWEWVCPPDVKDVSDMEAALDEVGFAESSPSAQAELAVPYSAAADAPTADRRIPLAGFSASETTELVAPVVHAHELPGNGNRLIGAGHLRDGCWFPTPEVAPAVPPIVWLPALGRVGEADGVVRGWRLTSEVPTAVALSERTLPDREAEDVRERFTASSNQLELSDLGQTGS